MNVTRVNQLSLFPGTQQVVGLATIGSNILKTIGNLFQVAVYKMQCHCRKLPVKQAGSIATIITNESNEKKSIEDLQKKRVAFSTSENNLKEARKNLNEHIKYIGIGILRFIPVVGTFYSWRTLKMLRETTTTKPLEIEHHDIPKTNKRIPIEITETQWAPLELNKRTFHFQQKKFTGELPNGIILDLSPEEARFYQE